MYTKTSTEFSHIVQSSFFFQDFGDIIPGQYSHSQHTKTYLNHFYLFLFIIILSNLLVVFVVMVMYHHTTYSGYGSPVVDNKSFALVVTRCLCLKKIVTVIMVMQCCYTLEKLFNFTVYGACFVILHTYLYC